MKHSNTDITIHTAEKKASNPYICLTLSVILFVLYFAAFIAPANAYENDLDGLLSTHVTAVTKNNVTYNGVDYSAWRNDPRHKKVVGEILSTNPENLASRNDKLAYWINAYNVLTIDLIAREGETETIKNLGLGFRSPWKVHKWTISGKDYALDDIEHKIIRPLGEPRIHFAINCAAISCPDLRQEAYRADRLEQQLEDQTLVTFQNKTKGYKVDNTGTVRVTKVMDWFKKDFDDGNLNSWIQNYFPNDINETTDIKFFKYNWALNKQ